MKKRVISGLLAAIMGVMLFAGCGENKRDTPVSNKDNATSSSSGGGAEGGGAETTFGLTPFEERQELRVGFFAGSPLSLPWYIADMEGYFEELNIEITYETFTNGPAMIEASNDWDVAGTGIGGALTAMIGYDIKTIGITDNEINVGLFAREGSAIAENPDDPEAWKGSTWLYPSGTTAQPLLAAKLEEMGLTLSDINSINMDISSALTAFLGGEGDGLGVWNAIAYEAEDNDAVRITDTKDMDIPVPCAMYATDDALEEKRELITTAYCVFYKTWELCKSSEEGMELAKNYYLENCEEEGIACDESIAERVIDVVQCPTFDENYEMMTGEADDYAGNYTKRKLLPAENEFLYCLDYFITQEKYTDKDRDKMLDDGLVDGEIAEEAKELLSSLGR